MTSSSKSSIGRADSFVPRPDIKAGTAGPARRMPLLYLRAHWTIRAHRRYLEAANFLWQR